MVVINCDTLCIGYDFELKLKPPEMFLDNSTEPHYNYDDHYRIIQNRIFRSDFPSEIKNEAWDMAREYLKNYR